MSESITLTKDEIFNITGKVKFAAQIKVLKSLGIPVKPRPDGMPVVARQAYLIAMGVPESHNKEKVPEPNYQALINA